MFVASLLTCCKQANLKDTSDQVNSVVTNAEQESILARLLQKVTLNLCSAALATRRFCYAATVQFFAVDHLLPFASQKC